MIKILTALLLLLTISNLHANSIRGDVTNVSVRGVDNSYTFSVTLKSVETGCNQYADWWEIVSLDGNLLYRRILIHSHPDTQPFTRSGSAINISSNQIVYIRAHMNQLGYVGDVFKGSVEDGFKIITNTPTFKNDLSLIAPLPTGCLY